MNASVGRAGFRVACLLAVPSAALIWLEPRGSAEQLISLLTLAVGLILMTVIAVLALIARR